MISFPNAKINIGLNILRKRADGFHEISSIFYPIDWCDVLEIIPNQQKLSFESYGIDIPGEADSNLCIKAYHLLREDFDIPPVRIILKKNIPIGAGLGGGSADASFALKMLNDLYDLKLTNAALEAYASQLGSDCPFFIKNSACLAEGRGEKLKEISLTMSSRWLLVINPNIHVSTKSAYAQVVPVEADVILEEVVQQDVASWSSLGIMNDFESSVFNQFPEVKQAKQLIIDKAPQYVSMTGSGASVYGFFNDKPNVDDLKQYDFRLIQV